MYREREVKADLHHDFRVLLSPEHRVALERLRVILTRLFGLLLKLQ